MEYAKFCVYCGTPATGKYCAKCGRPILVMENGDATVEGAVTKGTAAEISEAETLANAGGITLSTKYQGLKMTGFMYHRSGMAMGKYYTVIPREDGYDVVESTNPIPWPVISAGMPLLSSFTMVNMQKDAEWALKWRDKANKPIDPPSEETVYENGGKLSCVRVSRDEGDRFFAEMREAGVLAWDNFSESFDPGPGVYDGRNSFSFCILFENGEVLRAGGSNAYPDNYSEIIGIVVKFFGEHIDYSRYYPTEFPDEHPASLFVNIGEEFDHFHPYLFRFELQRGEYNWSLYAKDKNGEILEEGAFIIEKGEAGSDDLDRLYDTVIDLLKRYDLGKLNQVMSDEGYGEEDTKQISIGVYYPKERSYRVMFQAKLSEYGEFIREMILTVSGFCMKLKENI